MAIKRIPGEDHGFGPEPDRVKVDGEDMVKYAEQVTPHLNKRWRKIESGEWLDELRKRAQEEADSTDDARRRKLAQSIASTAGAIRQFIADGDIVRASWHAFELGVQAHKLGVMPFEKYVGAGRGHLKRMNGARSVRSEQAEADAHYIRDEFRRIKARNAKNTKTHTMRLVAENTGFSLSKVKRAMDQASNKKKRKT